MEINEDLPWLEKELETELTEEQRIFGKVENIIALKNAGILTVNEARVRLGLHRLAGAFDQLGVAAVDFGRAMGKLGNLNA